MSLSQVLLDSVRLFPGGLKTLSDGTGLAYSVLYRFSLRQREISLSSADVLAAFFHLDLFSCDEIVVLLDQKADGQKKKWEEKKKKPDFQANGKGKNGPNEHRKGRQPGKHPSGRKEKPSSPGVGQDVAGEQLGAQAVAGEQPHGQDVAGEELDGRAVAGEQPHGQEIAGCAKEKEKKPSRPKASRKGGGKCRKGNPKE